MVETDVMDGVVGTEYDDFTVDGFTFHNVKMGADGLPVSTPRESQYDDLKRRLNGDKLLQVFVSGVLCKMAYNPYDDYFFAHSHAIDLEHVSIIDGVKPTIVIDCYKSKKPQYNYTNVIINYQLESYSLQMKFRDPASVMVCVDKAKSAIQGIKEFQALRGNK